METLGEINSPLVEVEARLRNITPSTLYADVWINPTTRNLTRVFNHLRTMQRILYGLPATAGDLNLAAAWIPKLRLG